MCELYLKKIKDDYFVYLLGKNGEAKPKVSVNVSCQHKRYPDRKNAQLVTDSNGRVKLGPLKGIF